MWGNKHFPKLRKMKITPRTNKVTPKYHKTTIKT
jgi:hypothetical protein